MRSIATFERVLVGSVSGVLASFERAQQWWHHWGAWRRSLHPPVIGSYRRLRTHL